MLLIIASLAQAVYGLLMRTQAVDQCTMDSPIGRLTVFTSADAVSGIVFTPMGSHNGTLKVTPGSVVAEQAVQQLTRYFDDPHWRFQLKLAPAGTDFQRRVWENLLKTRAGQTLSYSALAERVHSWPRAVGSACGHNPLPIIIPCHRVIAADGGLAGFCRDRHGKFMLDKKRWLLAHEQR